MTNLENLAASHPSANDPYEPYQGVAALFNGDLYLGCPQWAPREVWEVVSPYEIGHLPVESLLDTEAEDDEDS